MGSSLYILILHSRKKSKDQMFREMANYDPDLMAQILAALSTGDTKQYRDLIVQHPEFLDNFIDKLAENEDKND